MNNFDFDADLFAAASVSEGRYKIDAALNQFLDQIDDMECRDSILCENARFLHALYKKNESVFYCFQVIWVKDHSILYAPVVFDESDRKCPPPQLSPKRFAGHIVHTHLPFSDEGKVLSTMYEWAQWRNYRVGVDK